MMKNKGKVLKLSTDPQSVAARERRHRISERFKILQSMVPGGGGAKMDTVSMLDEAIQYVKFLKAQISWLNDQHQQQSRSMVNLYMEDPSPPSLDVNPRAIQTHSISASAAAYYYPHPRISLYSMSSTEPAIDEQQEPLGLGSEPFVCCLQEEN